MTLPTGVVSLAVGAATDIGTVRRVNEDSFVAAAPVFLVADGMGGHARGDRASQAVARVFTESIGRGGPTTVEAVFSAIRAANLAVRDDSAQDAAEVGLSGTTLTGVALVHTADGGANWLVFNIGDSRVYAWDGRAVRQITVDHSVVQEMVDAGMITAEDAERHPERNVITRAIGANDLVEPDVWLMPAIGRQVFVICSDGLTKELSDLEIAQVLADTAQDGDGSVDASAERLVQQAVAHGGRDNVTAVVLDARMPQDDEPEASASPAGAADLDDTQPRR
ncbi:PP2C family protein-serine/threonine phosphatase [Compostimonas suwonensis]|nr:protein phosphatase 2C domain-containing protein [Compostimonas suwonensis]